MLSYLLVAVTAAAWLSAARSGRTPWWLVPLTWLWACCPAGGPIGLAIGGVAVGRLRAGAGPAVDPGRPRAAVVVLSAAATLVTPVGLRLLGAVLAVDERRELFGGGGRPDPTDPRLLACSRWPSSPPVRWPGTDGTERATSARRAP